MSRRTRVWATGLALAAALVLTACGGEDPARDASPAPSESASPEPDATTAAPEPTATSAVPQSAADLVGTWRDDTANWTAHFAADGTFTWDFQGNVDFLTGTYTFSDGTVTFSGNDGNDLVGEVTENGLVFTLGTLTRR